MKKHMSQYKTIHIWKKTHATISDNSDMKKKHMPQFKKTTHICKTTCHNWQYKTTHIWKKMPQYKTTKLLKKTSHNKNMKKNMPQ